MTSVFAVAAALLFKDGKILIAQRKATKKFPNKWELPGGKVEDGETPKECLVREMKEEFDIDVSVGNFLGESIYRSDQDIIRLSTYEISTINGSPANKSHQNIKWVSINELADFDFVPANRDFVDRLRRGRVDL